MKLCAHTRRVETVADLIGAVSSLHCLRLRGLWAESLSSRLCSALPSLWGKRALSHSQVRVSYFSSQHPPLSHQPSASPQTSSFPLAWQLHLHPLSLISARVAPDPLQLWRPPPGSLHVLLPSPHSSTRVLCFVSTGFHCYPLQGFLHLL